MYATIGRGATAAVHLGKLVTETGFERLVALKRLAPDLADDRYALTRFVDEARLTSRVRSANVAGVVDAVVHERELFLVMEYVHGPSLAQLIRATIARGAPGLPPGVAIAIVCGALRGLHAAHVAKGPGGAPLGLVHRDVSPQNVL